MKNYLKNGRVHSSVYSFLAVILTASCSSPKLSQDLLEVPSKSVVLLKGDFEKYQVDKIQTVDAEVHLYLRDLNNPSLLHIIHQPKMKNTEITEINYQNRDSNISQIVHIIEDDTLMAFNTKELTLKRFDLKTGQEIQDDGIVELFLKDKCYPMFNPIDLHYGRIASSYIFYCSWMESPELKDKKSVATTFRKFPFGYYNSAEDRLNYFGNYPVHLQNGKFFYDAFIYCAPNTQSPEENWFSFEMSDSVWYYHGTELKEKLYIPFSKKEKQEPFNLKKKLDKKYLWNYFKNRQSYSWIYFDERNNNLIRFTSKGDTSAYLILFDLDQRVVLGEFPVNHKTHDFQTLTPYENGFYVIRWFPKDSLTLDYFEWPADQL